MMEYKYYIVVEGNREGPLSYEELAAKNINGNTLVWRAGLGENWVKASELPEISQLIKIEERAPEPPEPHLSSEDDRIWFAMLHGTTRIGPHTLDELLDAGIKGNTPVWRDGMKDWAQADTVLEIMEKFREREFRNQYQGNQDFRQNPYYTDNGYNPRGGYEKAPEFRQNPHYQHNNNYRPNNHPYRRDFYGSTMQTNWLPWAIGATVVGFMFSCIGAIFGIIGIVQANKANNLYAMHRDDEAERVNNNAKSMTIIGYVLAGIGLIVGITLGGTLRSYSFW